MILKIRVHDGWWLEDNIRRIHHGRGEINRDRLFLKQSQLESEDAPAPIRPDAVLLLTDVFDESEESRKAIWVCVRMCDNSEKFIVFEEAFLLNDGGKTIEIFR